MNAMNLKPNRVLHILPFIVFFLLGSFYLYWFTSYIFFYQEKSILFLTTFSYLFDHLNQPGGFLIYLGELQTTFYFYPLVGAILVSLEICGIIFITRKIGKVLTGKRFYLIPFLLGAALFYLQTNYQYTAFNNLGILIQLLIFYRVITYSKKKFEWIPIVLFPIFYFLFGSFSLIFLLMLSINFVLNNGNGRWQKLAGLWLLGIIFFFIGKEYLFFQTTDTLVEFPYSVQNIGLQSQLFLITVFLIFVLPVLFRINLKRISSISIKKIKLVELTPFLIIIVLILFAIPRIDKKNSSYFHVEKLFYEHKYNELIQFNAQFPSTNILTAFLNNVSLAETGRLTESLFRFPQTPDGGTLFLKWEIVSEVLKRGGYFYYSIGMINEAQRWAYEYMVMHGNTPEGLKMLIKTELIQGNYKVANKFISILKKSIFYGQEARRLETFLFNEEGISFDPELGIKRLLNTKQDFFVLSDEPAANLDLILDADSLNSVAMEYKLAYLLLQKNMKGIVAELPKMEKMGYTKIPKNVEEAVVTFKLLNVDKMPELKRLKINPQTEQRFQQYYKIFEQNSGNKLQAQRVLSRNFYDTYWYYVFFN